MLDEGKHFQTSSGLPVPAESGPYARDLFPYKVQCSKKLAHFLNMHIFYLTIYIWLFIIYNNKRCKNNYSKNVTNWESLFNSSLLLFIFICFFLLFILYVLIIIIIPILYIKIECLIIHYFRIFSIADIIIQFS